MTHAHHGGGATRGTGAYYMESSTATAYRDWHCRSALCSMLGADTGRSQGSPHQAPGGTLGQPDRTAGAAGDSKAQASEHPIGNNCIGPPQSGCYPQIPFFSLENAFTTIV